MEDNLVQLRTLALDLSGAAPHIKIESEQVSEKSLGVGAKARREYLSLPFHWSQAAFSAVDPEILTETLVEARSLPRNQEEAVRQIIVRIAFDHAMIEWLADYAGAEELPAHLKDRFGIDRASGEMLEDAARVARIPRYALGDRSALTRGIEKALGDTVLPRVDTRFLTRPVKLMMPEIPVRTSLRDLVNVVPANGIERAIRVLRALCLGYPKAFIRDCEELVSGTSFRELGRRSGKTQGSYATVWRRKYSTWLESLYAAILTRNSTGSRPEESLIRRSIPEPLTWQIHDPVL